MKRAIFIISIAVISLSLLISCSANNVNQPTITAEKQDEATHYSQLPTDNSVAGEGVESTASQAESTATTKATANNEEGNIADDNAVDFNDISSASTATHTTTKPSTSKNAATTQSTTKQATATTKIVTDKDGWIDKWY